MLAIRASELANLLGGQLVSGSGSLVVDSVSTDTRRLTAGSLYIPLRGSRFDGREFLAEAVGKEAVGFLIDRWDEGEKIAGISPEVLIIKVKDTLSSLQRIAGVVRERTQAAVVGITGSTGKTSTKDMLACLLSPHLRTVWSEKSHNNEIGVPLTLLRAETNTQVVIVELAMRGLGQIKRLTQIAKPNIGVITNIGKSHFGLLESEKLIGKAKAELVEALPPDGVAILNADDSWAERLCRIARSRIVTYGIDRPCDLRAQEVEIEAGKPCFLLVSERGSVKVRLPILGRYNVYNALAAAAVALELGLGLAEVKRGLEICRLSEMRMDSFASAEGVTVINDAYNANPSSMEAALITLRDLGAGARKVAVLGDMLELGSIADVSHYQVGELAQKLGIEVLIAVGEKSKHTIEGALARGMDDSYVFACRTPLGAAEILGPILRAGDVVLVKGSRAMGMEEVINLLFKSVGVNG